MTGKELAFFWSAVGGYALSFLLYLVAAVFTKPRIAKAATVVMLVAMHAHMIFLTTRWITQGHAPIVSIFELVSSGSLFAITFHVIVYMKTRDTTVGLITIPLVFMIMGIVFFGHTGQTTMTQGFRSIWLYIHVIFALLSYGCFLCAAGVSGVYLVRLKRSADETVLERFDRLSYRLILTGFVATAVFIATGAVWAYYLWGRYWGWDPVESASLFTWLVYGLYLHLRLRRAWVGKRSAVLAIMCFVSVLISFWIVPFSEISIHVYEGM